VSDFLALFIQLSLAPCILTCMLALPPVLIMEKVSPTVHLGVLACLLVASLAALLPLRWRHVRLNSFQDLCCQEQTWITMLKCISDIALVVLSALDVSTVVHDGKQRYFRRLYML